MIFPCGSSLGDSTEDSGDAHNPRQCQRADLLSASRLHQTGKPKYHFAMKSEGNLAASIPEGFEIYENPNAQVFLRCIPPKIITDEERQIVENGMRKYAGVKDYKIDVKDKAIIVYTAIQRTKVSIPSPVFSEIFILTPLQTRS